MKNNISQSIKIVILAVFSTVLTIFGAFILFGLVAFGTGKAADDKVMLIFGIICLGIGLILLFRCRREKIKMQIDSLQHFDPTQPLVPFIVNSIILHKDEVCYLAEPVQAAHPKEVTVGYVGRSSGVSVRIMKGITVHSGGSRGTPVKKTILEKRNGILYVTNQRVILAASKFGFDKKFTALTSITPYRDGMEIQAGSTTYTVLTKEPFYVCEMINFIANSSAGCVQ